MNNCQTQNVATVLPDEAIDPAQYYGKATDFIPEGEDPETLEAQLREEQKSLVFTDYLKVRTADEIQETIFHHSPPLVEGLLNYGTVILAGTAKVGKSFLALQLAYSVSQGEDFLGFKTHKTGVIYFALEDTERRLQERISNYGYESKPGLYFITQAGVVGGGFEAQLEGVLQQYTGVGLVIIDVLQKIRDSKEKSDYNTDYNFIGALKAIADKRGICLLLIHHTRKMYDADVMNMVAGSRGLTGAVDSTMVLYKPKWKSEVAHLAVSGREMQDVEYDLYRLKDEFLWHRYIDQEVPKPVRDNNKLLDRVRNLLTPENPEWNGPASALREALFIEDPPNIVSRFIIANAPILEQEYGIYVEKGKSHHERYIYLRLLDTRQTTQNDHAEG